MILFHFQIITASCERSLNLCSGRLGTCYAGARMGL